MSGPGPHEEYEGAKVLSISDAWPTRTSLQGRRIVWDFFNWSAWKQVIWQGRVELERC